MLVLKDTTKIKGIGYGQILAKLVAGVEFPVLPVGA
jgi:hypothetical protein